MTTPMNCDMVRDIFFELRHGRIEKPQRDAFEAHIIDCQACSEYTEKLDSMLDEAMLWQPADTVVRDDDDIFAGIVSGIENGDRKKSESDSFAEAEETAAQESTDGEKPRRRGPGFRTIIAIAAVVTAVVALPFFVGTIFEDTGPAEEGERTAVRGELLDFDSEFLMPEIDESHQARPQAESVHLSDSLRLQADDDANWSLQADGDAWEIEAQKGTIVVEFLPQNAAESLTVRMADVRGQVVGTIFYVDAETEEIGVITGEVTVGAGDSEQASVQSGKVWRGGSVTEIESERWETLIESVDVDDHNEQLERLRQRSDAPDEPDEPVAQAPEDPAPAAEQPNPVQAEAERALGPVRLRMRAEEALRERDFASAAGHYEELLEILPDQDRAAGSVRLDLARIYDRQLDRPERTVEHLDYFIESWPDDAVTPRAISQLCNLIDDPDTDSRCRRR